MDAITAAGLSKHSGDRKKLDSLTFSVPEGTIFGLLGPSGSGKTTAVRLLAGLEKPDEGECSILGLPCWEKAREIHTLCGTVTEGAGLYGHMNGLQNLVFFGQLANMEQDDCHHRAADLMKSLYLWEYRDQKVSRYSLGMIHRLSLARSLMARPQVLLLDDLSGGLDPESTQAVEQVISSLPGEGVTVLLCSHQPRHVQKLCSSYGILRQGRLMAGGTLEELCALTECSPRLGFRLEHEDSLDGFTQENGWWLRELQEESEAPALIRAISEAHTVFEARIVRPELEEVYEKCLIDRMEAVG